MLTLFKKEKIKRKGGRIFFFLPQTCHMSQSPPSSSLSFLQQTYVLRPNLLPPLPLVQHIAAASLKRLISKDVPETSPTAAP